MNPSYLSFTLVFFMQCCHLWLKCLVNFAHLVNWVPQSFISNPFLLASVGNHISKKDSWIQAKGNAAFQLLAKSQTQTEKVDLRSWTYGVSTDTCAIQHWSTYSWRFSSKNWQVESSPPYCQGYWWQWSLCQPKGLHANWRWKCSVLQSTGNSTFLWLT